LVVRGSDDHLYHKVFLGSPDASGGSWVAGWDSPGGTTQHAPAIDYLKVGADIYLCVLVAGTDNKLYGTRLKVSGGIASWDSWKPLGGATTTDPAMVREFTI
jgi:hypothetical protein